MGDESRPPDDSETPSKQKESPDAYQRRLARALCLPMLVVAAVLPVTWFTMTPPGSLSGLLWVEGFILGPAFALLIFWRTGHDPKGYSKPLFGGRPPSDPK